MSKKKELSPEVQERYEMIGFHARPFAGEFSQADIVGKLWRLYNIDISERTLHNACKHCKISLARRTVNPVIGDLRDRVLNDRPNKSNRLDTQENLDKHKEDYYARGGKITDLGSYTDGAPKAKTMHCIGVFNS